MSSQSAIEPVSLYVHVPFCPSKCAYCDFNSAVVDVSAAAPQVHGDLRRASAVPERDVGDAYVDAAIRYITEASETGVLADVPTVYIGGGTPTLLGSRLVRLVRAISDLPGVGPETEFTVETNPETTGSELIGQLVEAGVNRFSMGIQSFDDRVLTTLGRCHDSPAAERAAGVLRGSRVPFSVDLICGVPGQGGESWVESVGRATGTRAGHLSIYPLSLERGTALAGAVEAGLIPMPDPDVAAEMMESAAELLELAGFERYEIASYALDGQQSRHNTVYWTGGAYLGVGSGAASMLPVGVLRQLSPAAGQAARADDEWRARLVWTTTVTGFLTGALEDAPMQLETLSPADALREDAMLGMRMSVGISDELAEDAGVVAVMESLADRGLVMHAAGRWRPTEHGWLFGNQIFSAILGAE
ncbi:MAG: coproporphyrinogen III oxidase [Actinobacteria bacterium HGW-Actinobacteria-7]|jgi:oxygen-independent coproporphyrinogen-3 oxidase|nr:MAG: coproporphyrinogen III oxidase [Actinobacteria bacterium HGW-Actinobacteria-7]